MRGFDFDGITNRIICIRRDGIGSPPSIWPKILFIVSILKSLERLTARKEEKSKEFTSFRRCLFPIVFLIPGEKAGAHYPGPQWSRHSLGSLPYWQRGMSKLVEERRGGVIEGLVRWE